MQKHVLFIVLFLCTLAGEVIGGEIIVRGFYYGRNLYVRNPYSVEQGEFCVKQVWVNGKLSRQPIKASAFEVDMAHLSLNQRVVVRLVFGDWCQPEITNIHVIRDDSKFGIKQVTADDNFFSWASQAERENSYYILERYRKGNWLLVDTIEAKGSFDVNQYSISVKHFPGDNKYRLSYYNQQNTEAFAYETIDYFSDEDPVELFVEDDGSRVGFSKIVAYELKNRKGEIVAKGEGVAVILRNLPRGIYTLYVENIEEEIRRK